MAALPPTVVDNLLSYLIPDRNVLHAGDFYPRPPDELRTLAEVSMAWKSVFQEVESERELRENEITIDSTKRSEMLGLRRQLTLRRTYYEYIKIGAIHYTDDVQTYGMWAALFSHAPLLSELDMRHTDLSSPCEVLDVCSRLCPRVQSVHLPKYYPKLSFLEHLHHSYDDITDPKDVAEFASKEATALLAAMERWSPSGGLKHISFCLHEFAAQTRFAPQVMQRVQKLCPNLERWSLYRRTVRRTELYLECNEQWQLDVESWTSFCEGFSHLTEFDWTCVPFATLFFEIFGQFPKPHLTKLYIAAPHNWLWRWYYRQTGAANKAALEATGFGPKRPVAAACGSKSP